MSKPHAKDTVSWMKALIGEWSGSVKTWFDPSKPADEGSWRGSFRPVAGGRYLAHEYAGIVKSAPHGGFMLIVPAAWREGEPEKITLSWVDTFHMSNELMACEGARTEHGVDVRGSYEAGEGPRWGWRTSIELHGNDRIRISMFNITPDGSEDRAVEVELSRET